MDSENLALATTPGQYLTFELNGQTYGVKISSVREIDLMCQITPVPNTPVYVSGVMNLRGKIVPVVSLRLRFGLNNVEATKETCIVIVDSGQKSVGVVVDKVKSVVELSADQIEPAPEMPTSGGEKYISGMGKLDNQVVILLNIVECLIDALGVGEPKKQAA